MSAQKLDVLIASLDRRGHKTIVFSRFTSLLAILRTRLDESQIVYEHSTAGRAIVSRKSSAFKRSGMPALSHQPEGRRTRIEPHPPPDTSSCWTRGGTRRSRRRRSIAPIESARRGTYACRLMRTRHGRRTRRRAAAAQASSRRRRHLDGRQQPHSRPQARGPPRLPLSATRPAHHSKLVAAAREAALSEAADPTRSRRFSNSLTVSPVTGSTSSPGKSPPAVREQRERSRNHDADADDEARPSITASPKRIRSRSSVRGAFTEWTARPRLALAKAEHRRQHLPC